MTVTPHQQIQPTQWKLPNNLPKHKEEGTRRWTINDDDPHLILCEIDSHDNTL